MSKAALALSRRIEGAGLLRVEEARNMLAECKRVDEAKAIRDKAEAIKTYLRQQNASREAQNDAAEIKLRAERRLGQLLDDQKKKGERAGKGKPKKAQHESITTVPTLKELGIERNDATRWQEAAKVPEEKFEAFIAKERDGGEITTAGLRREHLGEVRRVDRSEKLASISKANPEVGKLPVVPVLYVDPPWRYEHVETESRAIENQYPTMALEEICALKPETTPDAVLFMWATSPKLAEALRVVEEWGFSYRTCAVWTKDKLGMGYYFRQQHELLLVATKGSPPTPPTSARVSSIIEGTRGKHSEKPERVYGLIEAMYPELPRAEMFARQKREGWLAWGNQA